MLILVQYSTASSNNTQIHKNTKAIMSRVLHYATFPKEVLHEINQNLQFSVKLSVVKRLIGGREVRGYGSLDYSLGLNLCNLIV